MKMETGCLGFHRKHPKLSKLIDTDGDKLPDCIEQYISDAMLPDTDGDGLDDCYEAFVLYTSPTKTDTDETVFQIAMKILTRMV